MASANWSTAVPESAHDTAVGLEVLSGLTATPKTLSPWLFYDVEGSTLFEQITDLPEYYVTRTERAIFREHAPEIVRQAAGGQRLAVIELGAGTASKTGLLLAAAVEQQGDVDYFPIDVSASALAEAKRHLELELRNVHVHMRVGDYTYGLGRIEAPESRKLVLYIGSSIGNFEPRDATTLLTDVRAELAPGDCILIGADQVKPVQTLLAAYDDAQGITAAFNKNILRRINNELGADFDLDTFTHEVQWNAERSRIEMHLRSERDQTVRIPALSLLVHFSEGETIHTENSYKFTDELILGMLEAGGFALRREWQDEHRLFSVYLAEAV